MKAIRCMLGIHRFSYLTNTRRQCVLCNKRQLFAGTYWDLDVCDTREFELWVDGE